MQSASVCPSNIKHRDNALSLLGEDYKDSDSEVFLDSALKGLSELESGFLKDGKWLGTPHNLPNDQWACYFDKVTVPAPLSGPDPKISTFEIDMKDYWKSFAPGNNMIIAGVEAQGSKFGSKNYCSNQMYGCKGKSPVTYEVDSIKEQASMSNWQSLQTELVSKETKAPDAIKNINRNVFDSVKDRNLKNNNEIIGHGYGHLRLLLYQILTSPDSSGECRKTVKYDGKERANPYYEACLYGRDDSTFVAGSACGWNRETGTSLSDTPCIATGGTAQVSQLQRDPLFVESWKHQQGSSNENFPCQEYFYFPSYAKLGKGAEKKGKWDVEKMTTQWIAVPNPGYKDCLIKYSNLMSQPGIPGADASVTTGTSIGVYAPETYELPEGIERISTNHRNNSGRACRYYDVKHGMNGCKAIGEYMEWPATDETANKAVEAITSGNWVNYTTPFAGTTKKCLYDTSSNGSAQFKTISECEAYQKQGFKVPASAVGISVLTFGVIIVAFLFRAGDAPVWAFAIPIVIAIAVTIVYSIAQRASVAATQAALMTK